MYINKIDDLIDKIIDDFYNNVVKSKEFDKILLEPNFVKYQLDVNRILQKYVTEIDEKQIFEIVRNQTSVNTIIEIIKRYLAYYIFLTIGFFYKGTYEMYINNIIEFSKNQSGFNFKIDNFFNSENNGNVIRFYSLIKNILILLETEQAKISTLIKKKVEFRETINFLNNLGKDFVVKNFKLENLGNNKKDQAHNIIKTIILTELYFKQEKKDIYLILEAVEKETSIYTFIDIVVPRSEFIYFDSIENVLSKKDIEKGLAYDIYDLIIQYGDLTKTKELTPEEKILELINNHIIIPIVDDFLLYHKDSEKYEKQSQDKKKKKEDTRIRYIVSKIDSVTEYYSEEVKKNQELKSKIERYFYNPLSDRKAILVNNIEDIIIINKLINQGRKAIENNEYYNDLINYRLYPYVNFKNFKNYGFNLTLNKTIDIVRYVTFEKQMEDPIEREKIIQLRIGSNGQNVNIVGFMIPTDKISLQCIKARQILNVRDINYKKINSSHNEEQTSTLYNNTYLGFLKFLRHTLFTLKKKKIKPSIYWLINLEKDRTTLETYEQLGKMSDQEHAKLLVSTIYDDIQQLIYKTILKIINRLPSLPLYNFNRIINYIESKSLIIPKDSNIYNKLEELLYFEKYFKTQETYDRNEDRFPGLSDNIIKLPSYQRPIKKEIPTIKIKQLEEKYKQEDIIGPETFGAICQHIITWEKISAIRKKNPNEFNKLLFEFVLQYVIENYEHDYICKSCGIQIDIKNYILDGSYDDDGRFVTLSIPMDVSLEDLPDYEKYSTTIRNIDKLIEKIVSISNIQFLKEKTIRQRNPIKLRIIRDTLDMLIVHNNNMKEIYKERSDKIVQKYGINKELTNLFIFELDNNIFVYSSKDKDYYKPIKRNNILIYIIFFILLELNDSQIIYLTGDKICSYNLFAKYGFQLFNNIKIIKNNKNVTTPIYDYRVLCYIIFYLSCLITKYNVWQYEDEKEKPKKFSPLIQKIIINTLVDLMNSILEINNSNSSNNINNSNINKTEKHYLYKIVAMKFFKKLSLIFQNEEILKKIKELEDRRIKSIGLTKKSLIKKIKPIILDKEYTPASYLDIPLWTKCKVAKYFIPRDTKEYSIYYSINNITNCETGEFHIWKNKGKTMECSICFVLLDELKFRPELSDDIIKNYKYIILRKLVKKYCLNIAFQNLILSNNQKCDVCEKCKLVQPNELTREELDEFEKNIMEFILKDELKHDELIKLKKEKQLRKREKYDKFIKELKNRYSQTKTHHEDYYNHINKLIENIDSTIGANININNENIYTKYDTYIIDHDHNGYPLPSPIIISEKDNTMIFKKDHPFFKTDVVFYTNHKLQIDIFYNAVTFLLLGFKEKNKDYEFPKKNNVYITINYSILNKLRLLGFPSRYIYIKKNIEEIKKNYQIDDSQKLIKKIVSDLGKERMNNLKRILTYIQRYLYRIKYNYETTTISTTKIDQLDEYDLDGFIDKYRIKLKNMILQKEKDKIFGNWKVLFYHLFFQDLENKTINLSIDVPFLMFTDISFYDYHGNLILYYIVNELNKLLDFNSDKNLKLNIAYLIIDIINRLHNIFNQEKEYINFELKRFSYLIQSKQYVYDYEEKGHGIEGETVGFYSEYKDPDDKEDPDELEQKSIDREEAEALDIDTFDNEEPLDFEIDYVSNINASN